MLLVCRDVPFSYVCYRMKITVPAFISSGCVDEKGQDKMIRQSTCGKRTVHCNKYV